MPLRIILQRGAQVAWGDARGGTRGPYEENWSRGRELNPRPTDYESRPGANSAGPREANRANRRAFRVTGRTDGTRWTGHVWHQLGTRSVLQHELTRRATPGDRRQHARPPAAAPSVDARPRDISCQTQTPAAPGARCHSSSPIASSGQCSRAQGSALSRPGKPRHQQPDAVSRPPPASAARSAATAVSRAPLGRFPGRLLPPHACNRRARSDARPQVVKARSVFSLLEREGESSRQPRRG